MEGDEENQPENRIIMADTETNEAQLPLKEEEEGGKGKDSKPEGKNSDQNQCDDDNGVQETSFRDSSSAGTPDSSSDLLCSFEVPVEYTLHPFEFSEKSQGKAGVSDLESAKDRAGLAASAHTQNHKERPDDPLSSELSPTSVTESTVSNSSTYRAGLTASAHTPNKKERPDDPLSSELSPTSVSQSIVSNSSTHLSGESVSREMNRSISCVPSLDRAKSFASKPSRVVPLHRIPSHDGYNWRKYGQKQVKSPQGSRSYYRCTFADCFAKKIECSDHNNHVIEIVYRSHHNHDPPQKLSCMRGSKLALSVPPVIDSYAHEAGVIDDALPSTSSNGPVLEIVPAIESTEAESSGSEENPEMDVTEENIDEPPPINKFKRSFSNCSESPSNDEKKPKLVVHASSEAGISGDGYRWRKYGQKMVKGNPHPRNYYRCTSAGCPVRKHIERAKDNTNAFVITYKGKHDHDVPVPKKRYGPVAVPFVVGGSPMDASPITKSEPFQQASSTHPGPGEEAVGSARTLLGVGIEIKPC